MAPISRPIRGKASRRVMALGKNVTTMSGSRTAKADKKKQVIRGAEVSIRQSAAPGQIIYGNFKVGGIYTFLQEAQLSNAYLVVGSDNKQVGIAAKTGGKEGNEISVTFTVSGTFGSTTVTVTDKAISVRLKSSGGNSTATAAQVAAAINGNASASALVRASYYGNGAGVVDPMAQTFLSQGGGTLLHHVITLAAHEISGVDNLYLDDKPVSFGASWDVRWSMGNYRRQNKDGSYTSLVFMAIMSGTEDQAASPDLIGQLPNAWTANHRQRGCAHAYLITVWDSKRFAQGLPAISFDVRGKPVYDPRTSTTVFSTNAALIIADYLTNAKFGMGVDWADIDTTALIDAANVCDELITLATGGTEKRYQIEGVFDTTSTPQETLNEMADAIAGDIVYQGGKWRILPGKWRSPTVTLTRSDLVSGITVATRRSRRDTFNCVRGTIASKAHNFEPIDFPAIKVPTYIAEDGREIYKDLTLNFVTSHTQAQRIAKIRLGQIRQPIVIEATFGIKALTLQVGDVINYSDAQFGWSLKQFEVRDVSIDFGLGNFIGIKVTLVETAELIYTWSALEELSVDPAPNTNFPDYATVQTVTGLTLASGTEHLYTRLDGTVFARIKVSWTESSNVYVVQGGTYEIQYKQSSASDWTPHAVVSSDTTSSYILDVKDGQQYDVRVRALTAAGVASDWAIVANHLVIGKTAPPSNVNAINAVIDGFGILLEWTTVSDVDLEQYELRYGAVGASWSSIESTAIKVKANKFFFNSFPSGVQEFHVRAIDTSGNYSTNSTTTILTVAAPGTVQAFDVSQVDNNILVDWEEPTTGTFPISHYNVYKGASFATASQIGSVGGTFFAYLEKVGGSFTYWVAAVDIAGNEGSPTGKTVVVGSPPDYILIDRRDLLPVNATFVNCFDEGNGNSFLAPVNTSETWAEHFTNNSKTTIQDFIDAGFSLWLQPTPNSTATATWTYDLGTVLPQNIITTSWVGTTLAGSVTISPRISWRASTGDPWTDGTSGANQVFATNFRYVKVVLSITGASNLGLARVGSVSSKIDTKKQSDSGTATVTVAASGVTVNFNLSFLDVISIVATPQGTTDPVIPVIDFNDAPNPTHFKIYLYDKNGTAVAGTVRWTAEGVINNT